VTRRERYYKVASTLMRSARLARYQLGKPDMALVSRIVATARQYAKMARPLPR
jgi:hypothetical protein